MDLLDLDRVRKLLMQTAGERFIERVLTPAERELLERRLGAATGETLAGLREAGKQGESEAAVESQGQGESAAVAGAQGRGGSGTAAIPPKMARLTEFVAGRFSAKEAIVKALGCGIGKVVGFQDIEVLPDALGKPMVRLSSAAIERLSLDVSCRIHLSITHSRDMAGAYAVAEQV